jgi:D-arabinan endo alpha-(1,5)-arabinofuranosidase
LREAIVGRLAPQPTGPWDTPIPVATSREYPLRRFLAPASKRSDLYFTMTQYGRYNVTMMRAKVPADALNSVEAP